MPWELTETLPVSVDTTKVHLKNDDSSAHYIMAYHFNQKLQVFIYSHDDNPTDIKAALEGLTFTHTPKCQDGNQYHLSFNTAKPEDQKKATVFLSTLAKTLQLPQDLIKSALATLKLNLQATTNPHRLMTTATKQAGAGQGAGAGSSNPDKTADIAAAAPGTP